MNWPIIETYPVADEALWIHHATRFSSAFVISTKRDRWTELLTRRPRQTIRNSHKLHSDLDRRFCRQVADLPSSFQGVGCLYGFHDVPRCVSTDKVVSAVAGSDAIYSLIPGEIAIYFFHENEIWLCQR